ncbi:GntR family transcriptional regulator [Amphritea atlantica]|uniref:GntR family transcriptional regulator n=1 Tax=Amphritea atlantica TaxID=355243 RepID=A0ABY5H095_9GAMM|nr:GntR family transcriptional regulator [Amphritea atlantica]
MLKVDRPKTLKENALESLRDAITSDHIKPGERLIERSLCESMGVSRTVVRECIRHLESERLIVGVPNAGFIVASISGEEVKEIYELRILLECSAVKSCALKADKAVIAELRLLCKEIADCLRKEQVMQALKLTTVFYRLIFTTGGKHITWDVVERLNARISRLRAMTLSTAARRDKGPENLSKIVDAIEQHDTDRAEAICKQHLTEAAEVAAEMI